MILLSNCLHIVTYLIADAAKVTSRKADLHMKNIKGCVFHQNSRSFIGKTLKSREKEIILVGKYIYKTCLSHSLHFKKKCCKKNAFLELYQLK